MAKKQFFQLLIFSLILALGAAAVHAEKLPNVGEDSNNWGTILNQYLLVSHDQNGTLRTDLNSTLNGLNVTTNLIVAGNIYGEIPDSFKKANFTSAYDARSDRFSIQNGTQLPFSNFRLENVSNTTSISRILDSNLLARVGNFDLRNISNYTEYLRSSDFSIFKNISNTTKVSNILDNTLLARVGDFNLQNISNTTSTSQVIGLGSFGILNEVPDNNITSAKIASGAVTGPKLGVNSVTTSKIEDGAVGTRDIADGAVAQSKINLTDIKLSAFTNDFGYSTATNSTINIPTSQITDNSILQRSVDGWNYANNQSGREGTYFQIANYTALENSAFRNGNFTAQLALNPYPTNATIEFGNIGGYASAWNYINNQSGREASYFRNANFTALLPPYPTNATITIPSTQVTGLNTANWDTAYTDRLKWDGGSTGLVAATGRSSLGLVIGTDVQAYSANTAFTTNKLSVFAATTSAELAGVISDETGSGKVVFDTSPTLTTPNIGVATATSIAIGGGTVITKHLSATASLDFGATAAKTCDDLTIAVNGAADGDTVSLGVPNALASAAKTTITGFVSATNTVTVRRCNINPDAAADDSAAATVRADVWQH